MWLDKVRVGLWLGLMTLDKNYYGITPRFYIQQRINAADRMLLIYKSSYDRKGVTFIGTNSPLFAHFPSFIGLAINQFFLINVSTIFMLSRRLGLPYPERFTFGSAELSPMRLVAGNYRVMTPVIKAFYNHGCTEIYQPVHPIDRLALDTVQVLYKNNYTESWLNIESGVGKVGLRRDDNLIDKYPETSSDLWIPQKSFSNPEEIIKLWHNDILFYQQWLLENYIMRAETTLLNATENKDNITKWTRYYIKQTRNQLNKLIFIPPSK